MKLAIFVATAAISCAAMTLPGYAQDKNDIIKQIKLDIEWRMGPVSPGTTAQKDVINPLREDHYIFVKPIQHQGNDVLEFVITEKDGTVHRFPQTGDPSDVLGWGNRLHINMPNGYNNGPIAAAGYAGISPTGIFSAPK